MLIASVPPGKPVPNHFSDGEIDAVPQHAAEAGAEKDEKCGGHRSAIASASRRAQTKSGPCR